MRHRLIRQALVAGRAVRLRAALALAAAAAVLSGCGGGSNIFSAPADSGSIPSISDRYNQLFGSRSQAVGEAPPAADGTELDCPVVKIRAGASTYAVAPPGKQPVASELRYQATITRTARDCTRSSGQIVARIGIQGRVIAGPAGAPATVEIPLRVAVVQTGVHERVIATKVYRTTVSMTEDTSVPFSVVAEDLAYSMPSGATSESYVFYIGFDPQAVTPEPKSARKK
jgi:hypothetical protein